MTDRALIFGIRGALGSAIAHRFESSGITVTGVSRSPSTRPQWVSCETEAWTTALGSSKFNRVVFAQGENAAGAISATCITDVERLMNANVLSIIRWIQDLRTSGLLVEGCRICILGSVWANIARPGKLAYVVSKSAVSGLVRSLAIDLADEGVSVNAVLPGVVDTPMTRAFVSEDSRLKLKAETPGGDMVSELQIAEVCMWITSPQAKGIVGQSIVVDNGWSISRYV